MRKIISSLDIGSDYVKLVVGEFIGEELNILSAAKIPSVGIKNGEIVDASKLVSHIKQAVDNVSNSLGVTLKKVVLGIDSFNTKLVKTATAIKITTEDSIITGKNVAEIIQNCSINKIPEGHVLISVIPVEFTIDGDKVVEDPKGYKSDNLGLKAIIVTSPKSYVRSILEVATNSGLKTVDVVPSCVGDYYTYKNNKTDKSIGIVVNLGNQKTTLSVFNKGILTNTKVYPLGCQNIINDISFINKIDANSAKATFMDIGIASPRLANPNEYRIITDSNGDDTRINQYELSEIIADRLIETLELIKKQINVLTKKEISYIIFTGGLTELRDFEMTIKEIYGDNGCFHSLNLMGVRDNSYSSTVGILKYFNKKLELRGKKFSIFSEAEIEQMNNIGNKVSNNNESLLSKVFGYFFDN